MPKLFLSYSSITQGLHCGGFYPINTLVTSTRCFLFMSFVQSRPFSRGVRGACFVHRLTLKSIFRRMPIRLSIVIFTEPIKRQNGPLTVPPPIFIHPTARTGDAPRTGSQNPASPLVENCVSFGSQIVPSPTDAFVLDGRAIIFIIQSLM